ATVSVDAGRAQTASSANGRAGPLNALLPADSVLESAFGERIGLSGSAASRWMGWRLRMLVVSALIGCLGLFLLTREIAAVPIIDAAWRADAQGRIELVRSGDAQ